MLTNKHYIAVAKIIKAEFIQAIKAEKPYTKAALCKVACEMATMYQLHNPKFDRAWFLSTCGVE